MRGLFILSSLIFAAIFATATASANDICVACNEPAVTYVCRPTAAPQHKAFLQNRRLTQLACIREIARSYGHASCKANQSNPQNCSGELVAVDLTRMAQAYTNRLPKPLRPDGSAPRQTTVGAQKPAKPQNQDEPKTVVELAKRTVETSKDQLDNVGKTAGKVVEKTGEAVKQAGEAIEDGAEKTLRCLASLFTDC